MKRSSRTSGSDAMSFGAGRLASAVDAVTLAVDGLVSLLDFAVDAGELGSVMNDVVAVKNRFDHLITAYVSQAGRCGVPASMGLRTMEQVLGAETPADPRCYRPSRLRGQWLREFPLFEDAAALGEMSSSHMDLIRRRLDGPRTHVLLQKDQQILVDAARDCSFADFKKVADYWLIAADPDGDEPRDQQQRSGVSLRVGRGGRLHLRGEFDATTGQALCTAIDSVAQQLRSSDEEAGVVRSEAARRAEALATLVSRGAARTDGTHPKPLINIVMSQPVAEHLLEVMAGEPAPERMPVRWNDIDGRCELIDGTPIHPHHALKLFGVATFRRHIMDANSRMIDVAVNARSFPNWMRNALHIQARGACETSGCDAPHRWIQADHTHPWSRGGQTRLSNGQNQCAPDNQAKTNTVGRTSWHTKRRTLNPVSRGSTALADEADDGH